MSESIKKKIAALLAKAENTDNPFEADSFMAKVNELLEKHQIEMHEVRKAGDADPMGKEKGETNIYASMSWAKDVANALARYYGCRFLWWRRGNHTLYEVVGRESARATFELMLPFVLSQVKQQASRIVRTQGSTVSVMSREIGQALTIRIFKMIPKVEEHRAELARNALVPVNDVQAFIDSEYASIKVSKPKTFNYTKAAQDAAEKVSLHAQATGKHTKLLK
ncbi:DUF2786 domain-containing protein [Rhizobium phage RHph_Y17]|uniref:DUF2786 domain-containing protein n=2 Tax=Kleczkowskavirus RHEph4 TaxID=1921526 RepID=A0A7S5USX3_9CAUD|nr:DUF2786 domain-containing protein [Rhizobium phage RHph_Y17]QIG69005.1 DUF2786 domain-containing protein [Rhizobium phage RHph_Y3_43]QIG69554.1 DUF2786 domain-containing protein [Rhizobium phage RHph_I36]QIG75428.1 DUF2786 domain-containing protein [Rhizobium phage RHph_Y1_1]QIG75978.1 DUF2786 domain-containing protein [Rhizobium phage RHph_Y2_17_2]